jgi:hypothetical protein
LLVRYGYAGQVSEARAEASLIASAILHGARDRSRDPLLRTLRDQQRRSAPLHKKRPTRKKAARVSSKGSKAALPLRAPKAKGAQPAAAQLHAPEGSARFQSREGSRRRMLGYVRTIRLRHLASAHPHAVHTVSWAQWASVDWRNPARTEQGDKVAA